MSADVPLIVSVSGIRGIVGASLTPHVVTDFAACYGTPLAGETIVVSRDGRTSGDLYRHAIIAGLTSVGCNVVDIGIASTPTCGYYVKTSGAAGGIQITASHNPPEYNGLKLYRPEGFVLSPEAGKTVADNYNNQVRRFADWSKVGLIETDDDPHTRHIEKVLSCVNVKTIRSRNFSVVFDCNHGSGAVFGPRLLEAFGCKVDVIGPVPDGRFEHPPEPTAANLGGLCEAVKNAGADIGFAVDPDADRLAIVDNQGRYIGEEYTLALAIMHRTAQQHGAVVFNGSTSRLSEDAARQNDCPVHRTNVGEVHVAERMIAENAVIGGEGNGGVIDPRVGMGRDSAISMAIILELIASSNKPLDQLVDAMPTYVIQKDKATIDRSKLDSILDQLGNDFSDGAISRGDGMRVDWPDAWVQVRASNTEPIVRIIAESRQRERAAGLCEQVRTIIGTV